MSLTEHGIAVVVLAAGTSSRMGGEHKLRLKLNDGSTVLQAAVAAALGFGPLHCVVVMQPGMDDLVELLADLPVELVVNPDFASGMSSSLREGIGALGDDVAAALVMLGDEPAVAPEVIVALVERYTVEKQPITIPVYGDVAGPPTLFRREVFPELLELQGDEGGRPVVRRDPARVSRVPLPASLMPPDLDTPADYRRFLDASKG